MKVQPRPWLIGLYCLGPPKPTLIHSQSPAIIMIIKMTKTRGQDWDLPSHRAVKRQIASVRLIYRRKISLSYFYASLTAGERPSTLTTWTCSDVNYHER